VTAESGLEGIETARQELPDLILLDIWMPGVDGLETLEQLKRVLPQITVIMISGHGTIETAVRATKLGAFDFIEKPLSLEKVLLSVANALQLQELKVENAELKRSAAVDYEIIGETPEIRTLREQIRRVAPTSAPVLIQGENGTGKELLARSIHFNSPRRERPFVTVYCSTIPEELIESELFGHEKGALIGAHSSRKGRVDQADGGTLFLDEMCELSPATQVKILHFIQGGGFERVGGNRRITADIRIIASTTKTLGTDAGEVGTFNRELYYALSTVLFHLPTLRDRLDDVGLLAQHFVAQFFRREGGEAKAFLPEALDRLRNYAWPGNMRELKNVIERILIVAPGRVIAAGDVPLLSGETKDEVVSRSPQNIPVRSALRDARDDFEREFILRKLEENDWNISRTADLIEMERSSLQRKIKSYGIDVRR
jgi:two-component system nitrogen regulation response regulator NtrX